MMLTHTHLPRLLTGAAAVAIAGCELARLAPGNPTPAPLGPFPALAPAPSIPAVDQAMMRNPSTDVLSVVAWGMAIVLGALVLAFVARLLNHRKPTKEA